MSEYRRTAAVRSRRRRYAHWRSHSPTGPTTRMKARYGSEAPTVSEDLFRESNFKDQFSPYAHGQREGPGSETRPKGEGTLSDHARQLPGPPQSRAPKLQARLLKHAFSARVLDVIFKLVCWFFGLPMAARHCSFLALAFFQRRRLGSPQETQLRPESLKMIVLQLHCYFSKVGFSPTWRVLDCGCEILKGKAPWGSACKYRNMSPIGLH
jgi:hypothetical protein